MRLRAGAALAVLLGGVAAGAQVPDAVKAGAQVSFKFARAGLAVPRFSFVVDEDGSAQYEADEVVSGTATQHVEKKIMLTKATTAQIFDIARGLDRFTVKCASPAKNIADTGTKTLTYTGAGGDGTCTYNYSQDKRVVALTDVFLGISEMLEMGRKLEFDHRFDRLGLDAAMGSLVDDVAAGRAVEVGLIAPTLRSLANDSDVMERVRMRAAKLLQQAQPGS